MTRSPLPPIEILSMEDRLSVNVVLGQSIDVHMSDLLGNNEKALSIHIGTGHIGGIPILTIGRTGRFFKEQGGGLCIVPSNFWMDAIENSGWRLEKVDWSEND